MKTHTCIHHVLRIVALLTLAVGIQTARAQGTAFTYQGLLSSSNAPFSGSAEFQFVLWDAASGGNAVATNNPASLIATVTGGLFTVTLDFGVNPFDGSPRFLETGVRTAIGPFTTLTPRQPLTVTPYALRALNLSSNGLAGAYGNAVTLSNAGNSFAGTFSGTVSGTVSGDGSGLTNLNAATVGGLSTANFWNTSGNAGANPTNGAFIGTTDNLPLEFRANGQRVLRIEPTGDTFAPNMIGGISVNVVDPGVVGSTISGGGTIVGPGLGPNHISENLATIGGGSQNTNGGRFATIGGGGHNIIDPDSFSFATIAGGDGNRIRGGAGQSTIGGGGGNLIGSNSISSVISGGNGNTVGTNSNNSVIGGGQGNTISALAVNSVISGGNNNVISSNASFAMIPGGDLNTATNHAFAAGHRAKANHDGAFVWADDEGADFASTAANQFLIRAAGGVGIGTASPATALHVADAGDTEISVQNTNAGGHRYTLQSSATNASATVSASFQIIDRTVGTSRLLITTNGNVGIGKNNPATALDVNGTVTATAFNPPSDRNLKENFTPVSPRDVLSKVVAIPITRWNFISDPATTHVGPMAQDFHAAFGLGTDERHIATVDADGVALAAIQGLNQKLEEKDARIAAMEKELSEIKQTLAKLTNQKE